MDEQLVLADKKAARCPYCPAVVLFYRGATENQCAHFVQIEVSYGTTFMLFRRDK